MEMNLKIYIKNLFTLKNDVSSEITNFRKVYLLKSIPEGEDS